MKRKIKYISLKYYTGLIGFFYSSNDADISKMRNDFNLALSQNRNEVDSGFLRNVNYQLSNINYKMNLIMDFYVDPADAKPATGELYRLQNEMLEILVLFKDIVENHNLSYWLDYGTLLGAIRHGGFIPWDSDVDVSIMEDDLPRLTEVLNSELPEDYEFTPFWLDRVYRVRKKDPESKAFIDVYPYLIYGRDDNGNYKIRMRHGGDEPRVKTYRPHRPFPSSILFPLSETTFCGVTFKAPHDTDSYLRLKYGNYHLLPKSAHTEPGHPVIRDDIVFYPEDFV